MKIKLKKLKKAIKKYHVYYINNQLFDIEYDVQAIIRDNREKVYLVNYNYEPLFFFEKDIEITNDVKPKYWIHKKYNRRHIIKIPYDSFGYDMLTISEYEGPSNFIDDYPFLLELRLSEEDGIMKFKKYINDNNRA